MSASFLHALKHTDRKNDECYTPSYVVEALLPYLDKNKVYYEATSSLSKNIVHCFHRNNYLCMPSEGDFFNQSNVYDGVITNPPFSLKDAFLERCYGTGKPFALLLPITALGGIKRGSLFTRYNIQLLVFTKRVNFIRKKGNSGSPFFGVAWFCYKILPRDLIFYENKIK